MNKLRWQIRILTAKLGREGLVGIGMLALSFGVYLTILLPAEARIKQLQREIDTTIATDHMIAKNDNSKPVTIPERLAAYYRYFPPQSTAPDLLDKIYQAAKQQRLALNEGKYTATHERAGSLVRYEINLPVTGDYHQLHKFIGSVLNDIPVAALNGITYDRHKIGESAVDAKIKFSLYLGKPS